MVEEHIFARIAKNRRSKMTYILGLTGGIASGKSTVSNTFKELDVPVVDADEVSREVVLPGTKGLKQVKEAFGEVIVNEDGGLDRKQLGTIIFNSPEKRNQLNEILHPLIINRMMELSDDLIKDNHPLIVLDIPLLYEINFENKMDGVMVVHVSRTTQLERLIKRDGIEKNEAERKIESQMSLDKKAKKADFIIHNDGSVEETIEQVKQWYDERIYQ